MFENNSVLGLMYPLDFEFTPILPHMIKNIIFDLGGVLLRLNYSLTAQAFKGLGVNNFDQYYSQYNANQLFEHLETGKVTPKEFYKLLQQDYPGLSDADIAKAWNAMLLDYDMEAIHTLEKLKPHYRLFLLSNTNAIHLEHLQAMAASTSGMQPLSGYFEKAYFSNEIGERKPNASCYEYVINDAKLKKEETIFIDDTYPNVQGAANCGIRSILLLKGQHISQIDYSRGVIIPTK